MRSAQPKFGVLDFCRGMAALAVVTGHARLFTLATYSSGTAKPLWLAPLYLLTGLGRQAVVIFFVLSGFLIGRNVLNAYSTGNWSWRTYAAHRLARLWAVLIPALVLTVLFDAARGEWPNLLVALANAAFLQTVAAPTFGSNAPLWSLAYEFWYYVMFPLLVLVIARRGSRKARIAAALATIAIIIALPPIIVAYGSIWLMGVAAVALYERGKLPAVLLAVMGAVVMAGTIAGSKLVPSPSDTAIFVEDAALGLGFALMLPRLAAGTHALGTVWLARMSYSLYLTHYPFFVFTVWALSIKPVEPDADSLLRFAGLTCAALILAFGMYYVFERNTPALREFLAGLFSPASREAKHRSGQVA
jgi:peptidoglycan/LPS O-acetylase OafA/YrhL